MLREDIRNITSLVRAESPSPPSRKRRGGTRSGSGHKSQRRRQSETAGTVGTDTITAAAQTRQRLTNTSLTSPIRLDDR